MAKRGRKKKEELGVKSNSWNPTPKSPYKRESPESFDKTCYLKTDEIVKKRLSRDACVYRNRRGKTQLVFFDNLSELPEKVCRN